MRKLIFILVFLVAACVSMGNSKVINYSKKLVIGKTTKLDVKRDLGKPYKAEISGSGYEYWEYGYKTLSPTPLSLVPGAAYVNAAQPHLANINEHRLILQFNDKGILQDYRATVPTK